MKKIYLVLFILIIGLLNICLGQKQQIPTESNTHIFWQPNRKLKKEDFQGDRPNDAHYIALCDSLNLCTMAYLGLFAVLDVPKRKRKRGELIEKAYFAPAFEKTTSYILNNDSTDIEQQMLLFDIFEISARYARQELQKLQDSVGGYGIISMMYKSVESTASKMRESLANSYIKDVIIDKIEGAHEKWRKTIDRLLSGSVEYATKPEDCYRFIKDAPIDDNYEMAKKIIGNLWLDENE